MTRPNLLELEDLESFPPLLRDYMTDLLNSHLDLLGVYDAVVPILHRALIATGDRELLDLCSGGGGPVARMVRLLGERHDLRVRARLSDKYPNRAAFERAVAAAPESLDFVPEAVDAADVPPDLPGFRTLFTSFHHFPPETAQRILQAAVDRGRGIGVFEVTERRFLALSSMLLLPLLTFAITPFLRPRRLSRLLLTYVFPLVTAAYVYDGVISHLRSYTLGELREMTASLAGPRYRWDVGQVRHPFLPARITYLVGYPAPLVHRV
jgi:hypothetical protein